MSEIINALKKVIAEFDPIHVSRYKAECILQVINKYYVKRTELAEVKTERDYFKGRQERISELSCQVANVAQNYKAERDGYRDALLSADDLLSHADFKNGNEMHGTDEGEVMANDVYNTKIKPTVDIARKSLAPYKKKGKG